MWCGSFPATTRLRRIAYLYILTCLVLSSSQSLAIQSPGLLSNQWLDMAASVSFSGGASRLRALPTWSSSVSGDDRSALAMSVPVRPRSARPLRSPATMMGNVNAGKGLFAPLVVVARNIIGRKRFNQLRGKAIALHSQVITEFCKTIGADSKQRQGLIRLAKKNGEKLGFLA
ncbi:hypothetical protein EJB05_47579 [Eragrostis curvula]|uniref:Protein PROTON GRADIENT REGULATION 5, chloroplastic n=1 Tax=Eragrostis curvula TaxID=38414 RepID=A0A5J9SZF4_9POAL|nr:hypothetical protein EJB05_47579 [Eragrostis curvula]